MEHYKNTNDYKDRGENWDSEAACAELARADGQLFDEYFYPEKTNKHSAVTRMAKRICMACPVIVECLRDALEHDDGYGLKGGLTASEREKLKNRVVVPRPRKGNDAS